MGEAPDPVPPPMPAVTKTMSEPLKISRSSSRLSSAARWPMSGLPPEPKPLVIFSPMRRRWGALASMSAWASVLIEMNSTPWMLSSIMRLTAFCPPPPTPTTLICAKLSTNDGCALLLVLLLRVMCFGSFDATSVSMMSVTVRVRKTIAKYMLRAACCLFSGASGAHEHTTRNTQHAVVPQFRSGNKFLNHLAAWPTQWALSPFWPWSAS